MVNKLFWPYILDSNGPIPFLFEKIAPFVTSKYHITAFLNNPNKIRVKNFSSFKAYEPNTRLRVFQYIRASLHQHQLVHTGGLENTHYKLMRFIRKKPRAPGHIHTLRVDVDPSSEFNTKRREWLCEQADIVTAVSKHTARTAERHFSIEPTVIYNGVDPSTFHPDHPNSINYPWLRNVENLVIFVGKLISRKRPEDVIKVAKSIDNAHFVLIGDGSKADILSKESKEVNNLTLTGRLSKEKLPPIYANASVLLFPTLREGCPNVVLEALASGTPVVGYNATSMPELVIDGETGFLVEPGNINKLIEKVEILLNGDEQQRYSENARQHAVENHSFNIIAEDYLNVYSQTI